MAGRLDGKVALITGGARGQGAAEAALFAQEGAAVVITDVLDEEGRATADAIDGCRYLHQDVRDEDRWTEVVADIVAQEGTLTVLINNAGIFPVQTLMETSLEDYRRVIDINQVGVYLGMRPSCRPCGRPAAARSSTSRRSPAWSRRRPRSATARASGPSAA